MSQRESTVKLVFQATERGVLATTSKVRAAIRGLDDDNSRLSKSADKAQTALLGISKGMLALSAANTAVKVIGGTAGAMQQLAPAALVLPGALLAGAAAYGTFKLAMGNGAVAQALMGDVDALNELEPAARGAVKAVQSFAPAWSKLQNSVQSEFFDDMAKPIKALGDQYLPVLQDQLPSIARSMGNMVFQALKLASTPPVVNDINEVLDNTWKTLDNMGPALGNVLVGFTGIAGVGATKLPALGKAVDDVAAKFRKWVDQGVESGRIDDLINGAIQGFTDLGGIVKNVGSILGSVFTGLGGVVESPLARIRELTAQVAEFMKSASAQDGLRALGETLQVVGDVVGRVVLTAFKELAPTLVKLAPVAQEIARTLGDLLVSALETLGPLIRGVADVFNAFPGSAGAATTAVVGFVAAIKAIKAVNAVTDLLGIESLFGRVAKSADAAGAAGKTAGITWGKGFVGGLGLVGVGVAGTIFLDQVLPRDAAKTHGSQAARDMLGEMAATFSGEQGNIFRAWDVAKWISNPIAMAVEVGSRELQKLFQVANTKIPPITFNADIGPAQGQIVSFMNSIKGQSGTVNINGRTEEATQALAELVQRIQATPDAMVTINGQTVPAQEALQTVIGLINSGVGLVTVNGNTVPAGDALAGFLQKAQGSTATATLNANGAPAYETVGGWTRAAEGTVGMAALDANKQPADGKVGEWVGGVSRTRGTATLDANPGPANTQVAGWKGRADGTTGTSKLNADPGQANGQVSSWKGSADRTTATAKLSADPGPANAIAQGFYNSWAGKVIRFVLSAVTGSAEGGPVVNGRAGGGPIRGPGTGTSDTAGLYALSNGEHVLTAREVAAAGGHAAIFALRRSLSRGQVPRMTAVRGRAATGGSVSSSGALTVPTPQVSVSVHIGNQEITDIVRTQIATSNRQTRRTVGMGAGTTF